MTEEQVEKHGDVIKWFCDNPKKQVWQRSAKKIHNSHMFWIRVKEPNWYTDKIYVQDDKYAELRKAQVDGKIIQSNVYKIKHGYSYSLANNWNGDCFEFVAPLNMYRIKPDEPKFKIGDWLTDIKGVDREKNTNFLVSSIMVRYKPDDVKLWKPEQGKWCCLYDEVLDGIRIEKFSDEDDGLYYGQCTGESFANVAPLEFIQHLKDNQ